MTNRKHILRIALMGLLAALAYVSFTFLKINIPTPAGYTAFHLGNTFDVLASLLLGGLYGGLAGAIGMGIGDILDPIYITVAPKTIILKMMIGLVTGFVAHKIFKISELKGKKLTTAVFISSACGMLFNGIGEPLFSYFYTSFVLNAPEKAAKKLAQWNAITTFTNAILAVIIASLLYLALRKRFENNNIIKELAPRKKQD